jgi:signal transduction histidine kinase
VSGAAEVPGADAELQAILLGIAELAPLTVLTQRLADAARRLTRADNAAIGQYDSQLALVDFVTSGPGSASRDRLPHPPQGVGLLGRFAQVRETVAVEDVAKHSAFSGFPADHVPMGPFLGVPVVYGGRAMGAFYVTRSPGQPPFSAVERTRLEQLAPYAAIAMANARTLERERARADAARVLGEAAQRLQQEAQAHTTGELVAFLGGVLQRLFPRARGVLVRLSPPYDSDAAFSDGPAAAELASWADTALAAAHGGEQPAFGARALGYVHRDEGVGVLLGAVADGPILEPDEALAGLRTAIELGADAITALQRREADAQLERYALRDSIARDLHDDLIQSIYAVGLSLRAAESGEPETVRRALRKGADDLNAVIRELRAYIAHLSERSPDADGTALLTSRIRALFQQYGTRPAWTVELELGDTPLDRRLERQLYFVVREAVSNVERHAAAQQAALTIRRDGERLRLELVDDGRGFAPAEVSPDTVGLRSIEQRVADLGGSVMISSAPGAGTRLVATFPITEAKP